MFGGAGSFLLSFVDWYNGRNLVAGDAIKSFVASYCKNFCLGQFLRPNPAVSRIKQLILSVLQTQKFGDLGSIVCLLA